jgi:glycerol-3-phosphate dehydrogenase
LPLTIPIYDWHRRAPLLIRAGMIAYDVLSYDKSLPRHRMMSTRQALEHEPGLSPQGLNGAARYYDAQVEFPERVAVESTIDAVAHGAVVRTGADVHDLIVEAGVVRGVRWRDTTTGEEHAERAHVTVNVAGPWVDEVLASLGLGDLPRLVGGTKGSHIVVDPFPGAPDDALYVEASADGRPYFIIPWNTRYLIGTTDTRYDGDLDHIVPTEEEIRYLLDEANLVIPSAGLTRESVLYAYAGLRPLPWQPEGKTSGITRRHIVRDHAPKVEGLLSIIGGKLTTYRNLAEQAVDDVYGKLGRKAPPSPTRKSPLPGAAGGLERVRRVLTNGGPAWLAPESATYLLRVYGTRAEKIVARAEAGGDAARRVVDPETGLIGAAVELAFEDEHARTLADVLMRRTMVGYNGTAGIEAAEAVAGVMVEAGRWSQPEAADQVASYLSYVDRYLPRAMATQELLP